MACRPIRGPSKPAALPPGLNLNPDGNISGIPTISGAYPVTFGVTDSNQLLGTAQLTIDIGPLSAPGYWEVSSDGGIFSYGGAQFYGSTGGLHLNAPIIAMAATPDAGGYWLLASDGGIFSFGDAVFYGSTGGTHLNAPIVGMTPTPDGGGYWLVASDGGIFSYGDAGSMDRRAAWRWTSRSSAWPPRSTGVGTGSWLPTAGSSPTATPRSTAPPAGCRYRSRSSRMTAAPDGGGYWLVASDGGIFSFGDVSYFGSMGGAPLNAPIVGMDRTADGQGVLHGGADGGIFSFGDAGFFGSAGRVPLNEPVVGIAAIQSL